MKEVTVKLTVMLSDAEVKNLEKATAFMEKMNSGWTVNDELKMLARRGIKDALAERGWK